VYVTPPRNHPDYGIYVWRLKRSMYGLRDASRHFAVYLRKVLVSLAWEETIYDGIYLRWKNGIFDGILFSFVDDLLAGSGATNAKRILEEIKARIDIKLRGVPTKFVGIDVDVTSNFITLSQHKYAESLEVEDATHTLQNPVPMDFVYDERSPVFLDDEGRTKYRALLGKLAFMSATRPDIQLGISLFGSFAVKATAYKYEMLYRMAQHAKQTAKRGIRYRVQPCSEFTLEAWSDASFESDVRDAQSGYIIALNGSPIFWRSCKQRRSHHSTVKAEAEAFHDCLDRVILLLYFLSQLRVSIKPVIYSDALDLVKLLYAEYPKPTAKHLLIEIREIQNKLNIKEKEIKKLVLTLRSIHDMLHYLHDQQIRVQHIPGLTNPSDVFTKIVDTHVLVSSLMHQWK
jgi:hypothetical protein